MIDNNGESIQSLLDRLASGALSRRTFLAAAASNGLLPAISEIAITQAVKASEIQGENRKAIAKSYDYIVVGAGSAGCAVASRIAVESDASVLLIEAGPSDQNAPTISDPTRWVENLGSQYDWKYFYAPTPNVEGRNILLSRGKVLGGSSSINALVWIRGDKADYDGWAANGNVGWDYESVLPLFKKSEDWAGGANDVHGAGGPIRVETCKNLHPVAQAMIDAGKTIGMPLLADNCVAEPIGVGPLNMNVRDGARCSSARGYLRPAMARENLTVLTNAQVTKLTIRGDRCVGAEILIDGELRSIDAAKEVVLSAGTIDTPRLLMLSGIGNARDLKVLGIPVSADRPGVGQNLHDHVLLAGLCFEASRPMTPFNNNLEGSLALWKSKSALSVPDLMFVTLQMPVVTDEIRNSYSIPQNGFVIAPGLMNVKSRGSLKMLTSKHDSPLEIQPNFLSAEDDVEALLRGIELGLEMAATPAFKELTARSAAPAKSMSRSEATHFIRLSCLPYFHPVGTCAMGQGKEAVVDSQLNVHGIRQLRVADASIMPKIPSANTNAPTVMIGEFAAQAILNA